MIEKTWNAVLEKFQTELPRAAFDTWVRDTRVISAQDGVLTVSARNAYAREWLASHLTDTANEILSHASLRVNFVVVQETIETDVGETDVAIDAQEGKKKTEDDRLLDIAPESYDSIYEQIIRPDRAAYIPGYFRRWLPNIGPDLAWMYVSFRQAAYRHGGRNNQFTNRFSAAELANRAGITERTLWNRAANPSTWERLSGLVTRVEEEAKWDIASSTPKQLPRKFTVAMTMPLTPVDAVSLRKWLIANQKNIGAERVLRMAMTTPLEELLPRTAETAGTPATVRHLTHELFGGELDAKLIDALAAGLQNHIMPTNDHIKISVFFMEHVLPHLGAGPAWVVTLLRDRCYENRNRVVVKDGYAEIASWLGITRVKTVWEWLTLKKDGKYINSIFRMYVREAEGERGIEDRSRVFYVLVNEVASEMFEAFVTGRTVNGEFSSSMAQITGNVCRIGMAEFSVSDGAFFSLGMAHFSAQLGAFFSLGMAQISYLHGANFSLGMAQISYLHGANFIVKNSLTLKPNSLNPKTSSSDPQPCFETAPTTTDNSTRIETAPTTTDKSGGMGNMGFWDFDFLTSNNSVNPGGKGNLLKANKKFGRNIAALSGGFVSWLLYAYSPAGLKITDPVGVAIKRLCENVSAGAGGDFNRLAKLTPYALRALFDADMAGVDLGESLEAGIYKLNFQDLKPIHKSELYRRLFGDKEPKEPNVNFGGGN